MEELGELGTGVRVDGFISVDRAFFERDVFDVAPSLLGCCLERSASSGVVAIRIPEVEAYAGERDPGAHAYRGRTARNASMFGAAGHALGSASGRERVCQYV